MDYAAEETTPLVTGKDSVRIFTLCLLTEEGGRNANQEAPPSYDSVIKGIVIQYSTRWVAFLYGAQTFAPTQNHKTGS